MSSWNDATQLLLWKNKFQNSGDAIIAFVKDAPAPCFSDNFLEDRIVKKQDVFYPLCHMQRSLLRSEVIDVTALKSSLIKFMAIFYEYDGV